MLLVIFDFLMKFADISKMQGKRIINNNNKNNNEFDNNSNNGKYYNMNNNNNNNSNNNDNNNHFKNEQFNLVRDNMNKNRWQHVSNTNVSNSSSSSSGCDSGTTSSSSSKENNMRPHSLTPQQLQQMGYYQQLQQQQLQLLQEQLLERKQLQEQLQQHGAEVRRSVAETTKTTPADVMTLTCNQQYLRQMRLQQQQQQQQQFNFNLHDQQRVDNYIFHTTTTNKTNTKYNFNDILNNNSNDNNNTNNISYSQSFKNVENCDHHADAAFIKGQKIVRGMTEFSINNDLTNNTSHLSFHLPQNSPRHHFPCGPSTPSLQSTAGSTVTPLKPNSTILPQHLAQLSKNLLETHKQTLINHKNNQHTLNIDKQHSPSSVTPSTTHSPTHYRNPFNSPNNSPFSYNNTTYANNSNNSKRQQKHQQQHRNHQPQQQQLRQSGCKIPLLTYNQYQQHLNDLLLQQQHLAKHQRKLLQAKDSDNEELSEESLKQNVAIVLNNLNRYNNALRSIILSEHINSAGNVFYEETDLNLVGGAGVVGDGVGVSGVRNCEEEGSIVNNNLLCNMAAATTPESDYNSNATTPGSRTGMLTYDNGSLHHAQHVVGFSNVGGGGGGVFNNIVGNGGGGNNAFLSNNLSCSLASAADFTHDNSDYQWFLDCGYRDGYNGMQRSVLSSLAASYNGLGDFVYEDMSKHLDANLAQADIESFRTKDIQLLLSQLPSYCKNLSGSRLQQSLMLQQHINSQQLLQQQHISQSSTSSTNDLIDNSICKSELLFSPVKESHISVDSMDLDAYPEDDEIILTYKANKDNYTIAFEGSVLYSDDSFYEPNEIALKNTQNFINLHTNLDDIVKRKSLEVSMSRSEQPPVTSYNGLQKNSHIKQLQRYPSGNNNTAETITIIRPPLSAAHCSGVRKCSSLPNLSSGKHFLVVSHIQTNNLKETKDVRQQKKLNVSQAISTSNVEPNLCARVHNLLPMCQMPISCNSISGSIEDHLHLEGQTRQQQLSVHDGAKNAQHGHRSHKHRCCCVMINNQTSGSGNVSLSASGTQGSQNAKQTHISASASSGTSNVPAFNLVKLFIKQKSSNCSLEDPNNTQTCMDVSSGCWPSIEMNGFSSNSSIEQLSRKKSMHDSGKGSGLSRHDEEEADCNSSTFQINTAASTPKRPSCSRGTYYDEAGSTNSSGSITATNSPAHPSEKTMPLRNPTLCHLTNEHNSHSSGSLQSSDNTSDQLTQVFKTSLRSSSSNTHDQQDIGERTTRNVDDNQQERISHVSSSEMITRSMQTSCGSLSTRSSLSGRFRCVPPSFLEKLHNLGEECQAPIYVIYPNYALPDLEFVKHSTTPDVIFSPFNYKMTIGGAASSRGSSTSSLKKRCNLLDGNEENEILKTVDYKHVVDWVSLATLLPADYRRRLKHITEVKDVLNRLETELSHKPLFCLTPAVRRNRPHICDCAQYFQRDQQTEGAGSSSSGSSHQPSSGYRGSSTLLTDSDFEENATVNTVGSDSRSDALKQMYVYQYEQQRMEGGVEDSPKVQTNTPLPMPRGILRKSSSSARNKRNSMVEPGQGCSKLNKVEKRRSLQEPPYRQHIGSAEELTEVFEEECFEMGPNLDMKSQRLSRKDLDARIRAENFLSSLPRHELKYYVEIAAILESSEQHVQYDAAALKKEVSRALSQQKKVSFNDNDNDKNRLQDTGAQVITTLQQLPQMDAKQRFSTPPNSPNISVGVTARGGRLSNNGIARPCSNREETAEKRKQEKNRFKRMQIQWELMSKDSSMLKELESIHQTKSGATTPTSATAAVLKSRIPRPVSYPAGKGPLDNKTHSDNVNTIKPQKLPDRLPNQGENSSKMTKSPSRIVPPKHYRTMTIPLSTPNTPTITTGGRARTLNSRAAVTAPNTPKKRMQSPRTLPRIR